MKLNIPGYEDAVVSRLIDPAEWIPAKWRATAYLYQIEDIPPDPPGLVIGFLNLAAGKKIFDSWLKQFGHTDTAEELRISIVEGPIPSDPNGYTVVVSSNPFNAPAAKSVHPPVAQPNKFIRFSQMNRMSHSPSSPHLRLFKAHFAKTKRYRLFPAHFDGSQIKEIDLSRFIEKRELNFRHTSDLKPHEMEYAVFNSGD